MKNKILNVILIGYIIVLIWLLLVPNVFRGEQTWYSNVFSYQHFVDSNLIPFRTIIMYIYCLKNGNINIDIPIKNVLANFFMFMPITILIKIKKSNRIKFLLLFFISFKPMFSFRFIKSLISKKL